MARRSLCARAALVLGLAACGRGAAVRHPAPGRIAAIELRGNRAIDDDTLIAGLALRRDAEAGLDLDPYELALDARRLEGVYQRRGYFGVAVRPAVEPRGDAVAAVFAIDEGPRATLARVDVIGAPDDPAVSAAALRALVPLREGDPFDYDAYDDAKPRVLAALQDASYARARLDAAVVADRVHHEAVIRLEIEPGPRCVFGAVSLAGVDGALAGAARARFAVAPGAPYSNHAVAATRDALYELGRFSVVRVEPDRDRADATVPVAVSVVESAKNELRAGLGVGIDPLTYLLRPRLGYSRAGFLEDLTMLDLDATPALAFDRAGGAFEPRLQALASLRRMDLWRPRLTGEIVGAFQYLTVEAYTSLGPRLRLGLTSPVVIPQIVVHAGWQIRQLGFVNIVPTVDDATRVRLGIDHAERVTAFEQSVIVDLRDKPLEPRRGLFAAVRVAEGAPWAGGGSGYVQLEPDLRGYLPLGPLVLAAHARAGAILGDVPPSERYFAGGASSQRGFPERQLSPFARAANPDGTEARVVIGGAGVVETGVEVRATVGHLWGWPLIGAVFADGADVTDGARELDVARLHWAAGSGLRLSTPYGPVRIDFGYRLNRTGADDPLPGVRFAYQIGFGEAF